MFNDENKTPVRDQECGYDARVHVTREKYSVAFVVKQSIACLSLTTCLPISSGWLAQNASKRDGCHTGICYIAYLAK